MASIFLGQETDGLDRIAGYFYDGQFIRYAMITNHKVVVFDTYGNPIYTEQGVTLPGDFVPKSIQCLRSRQTGKLVVGLGGFMSGGSKQRGCIVATDYFMQE
jgi:hypothetical protein